MSSPGISHAVQTSTGKHSAHSDLGNGNRKKVFKSWKEIASHLGSSVRTVQRWEAECGLPVRRPRGSGRGAVIALGSELDGWVRSRPVEMRKQGHYRHPSTGVSVIGHIQESQRLRGEIRESRRQLLDSVTRLRQTLTRMLLG